MKQSLGDAESSFGRSAGASPPSPSVSAVPAADTIAAHTPGPWIVHPLQAWVSPLHDLEMPICLLRRETDGVLEDERVTYANARLIAEAPTMARLLEYPPCLPSTFDQYDRFAADYRRWVEEGRAAIARVRGES